MTATTVLLACIGYLAFYALYVFTVLAGMVWFPRPIRIALTLLAPTAVVFGIGALTLILAT